MWRDDKHGVSACREVVALMFDVFGTVVDWRTSVSSELDRFAKRHGLSFDCDSFADGWRDLYQPAMEAIRSGERPFVTLDVLHRENLETMLVRHELSALDASTLDDLNRSWHRLRPWPDSVQGLARLKASFILATLSNGNVSMMVNLARFSGLPWDMILGAEIAGSYKREPVVYEKSAELLGLEPHQCMMVAAHNGDLTAARAVGFRTAYVNRPTEHGLAQTTDLGAQDDWDIVASSMVELADTLGC